MKLGKKCNDEYCCRLSSRATKVAGWLQFAICSLTSKLTKKGAAQQKGRSSAVQQSRANFQRGSIVFEENKLCFYWDKKA